MSSACTPQAAQASRHPASAAWRRTAPIRAIGLGLGPTWVGAASDFFAARHIDHALQIALLIPILAGLVGLFNSFRMMRLPDPKPSGSAEGIVLG